MREGIRQLRRPATVYVGLSSLLIVLQHVSNRVVRDDHYAALPWKGWRFYLDGWSQFDGVHYETIAAHGYSYVPGQRSNVVWFPLYPLLMRLVDTAVGDLLVSGVVVSLVAGLVASLGIWSWLGDHGLGASARWTAFLVTLLYPYGFFLYGVIYADAVFVAAVVWALVLVDRRLLVSAGLVAAVAAATRPNGLALVPALLVLGLVADGVLSVPADQTGWAARIALPTRWVNSRLRAASAGPLLASVGLGAWCWYLWARWGDPLLFLTNQSTYHEGKLPLLKLQAISRWLHFGDDPTFALTIAGQAIVLGAVLLSVPAVCRRFGFGNGLFVFLLAAMPTVSTEDFMGTGRYLMPAIPVFALWGEQLSEHPTRRRVWLTVSALLLVLMSALFARSTYLT